MDRPYVERLRIQNLGCIQDAEFQLTPLHALIGPNDSGKSTVLKIIRALSAWSTSGFQHNQFASIAGEFVTGAPFFVEAWAASAVASIGVNSTRQWIGNSDKRVSPALLGCQVLRLDPDALRQPSALIQDGQPLRLANEHGAGLPGVFDAIITRDVAAYIAISSRLSALFPSVKSMSLKNPTQTMKALGVQLTDGKLVPAATMSEGLLYWLAFAALPYLEPTALMVIEEPETGLHPARIRDVMTVLREISETTQVILATHSPLVINELKPEEVTVLTRGPQGTKSTLIKNTPNFDDRSKVYSLGELWLSYANGLDEAPLLQGGPRP